MEKRFVIICFFNFLIAATMGLLLRSMYVFPITFINFRFLTHAHSHVAMLGWVYLSLQLFIVQWHVKNNSHKKYKRLFWVTQLAVVGMLLSFPFQGYAMVSICFSTLHIFCSYIFAFYSLKAIKPSSPAKKFIRLAIYFMLASTLGVWCLGPTVIQYGKSSVFYQLAIQFFLHFQFNGWFLIAVLSFMLQNLNIKNSLHTKKLYIFISITTVLTYAFPASWYLKSIWFYWGNFLSVLFQLVTLYYLYATFKTPLKKFLRTQTLMIKTLYIFAIVSFIIKIFIQTITIIPEIAKQVYLHKNLVIGFIHLIMLGIISCLLFAYFNASLHFTKRYTLKIGTYSFLIGLFITEVLLLLQGVISMVTTNISIPSYYQLLFFGSFFLVTGILFIVISLLKKTKLKLSA